MWFPAAWPETYSFTLSAAIEAGLPIVASEIGAFPERLAGRPLTWLIPPTLDPAAWLTLFERVAIRLRTPPGRNGRARTDPVPDGRRAGSALAADGRVPARSGPGNAAAASPALPLTAPPAARPAREPPPKALPTRGPAPGSLIAPRRDGALIDLRRAGATSVLVIPETFDDHGPFGSYTPCAHIRLLRPLDHPATGHGLTATMADAATARRYAPT